MKNRSWTDEELRKAVKAARSRRQVLVSLGLQPKGGNYAVVKMHIARLGLSTTHFTGMGWNKDGRCTWSKQPTLEEVLVLGSNYQSYKLKKRLYREGLKEPKCELCDWAEKSVDGRIPLELDHINGDHQDNRLANLRILCPNCHSLQPTHRGRNKMRNARVAE